VNRLTRRFELGYGEDLRVQASPLVGHGLAGKLTGDVVRARYGRHAHLLNLIDADRGLETRFDHFQRTCDYCRCGAGDSEMGMIE
jgi:hypothetical protein